MIVLPLLLACGGAPSEPSSRLPPPEKKAEAAGNALRFQATKDTSRAPVLARARRGDQPVPFGWHELLREDQAYGGPPFGTILDGQGKPLSMGEDDMTCSGPDFNGLMSAAGRIWLLTHLECSPAGLQRSLLERVPDAGFRVLESVPSTITVPEGLNNLCAGDVTPWNTLLSGEEYETDVALVVNGRVPKQVPGKADGRDYGDWSDLPAVSRFLGGAPSPYRWGWMVETWIQDGEGTTENVKRHAMGRFSHELGLVMPDQRTVYMTDDNTYGLLAMFVADSPANLSAGTLYAARWEASDKGHTIRWISLGHATDEEIRAALPGIRFEDLYERTIPEVGACPEGFVPHRNPQKVDECLKPVAGKEILASRLETRRAAALAGATTELNKEEGLALDAEGRRLFVATTRIGDGMLAADPPFPGRDHLALEKNPCGVIWALTLEEGATDSAGAPIDSPWVASAASPAVSGVPEGEGEAQTCAASSISEPDNLAWIPGDPESGQDGVLLIAEDTDRSPNLLWAWQDGALLPIFAGTVGATGRTQEISGLSWVPDVGGASWITISMQHGEDPATVGVLGPF